MRVVATVAVTVAVACSAAPHPVKPESRVLVNERAFARLYGTLRWFHPSDECAALDWDRFAIYGATRVHDAPDAGALAATLRELVTPIAPTVRIGPHPEAVPPPVPGSDLTWWEHAGPGITGVGETYASKRFGIAARAPTGDAGFGGFAQSVLADPYRGKKIRLRGRARVDAPAVAQLWLRVDRGDKPGFFDNMQDRPIRTTTWSPAEIIGTVDPDATGLVFGSIVDLGEGAWFDDFTLEVEDGAGWKPIPIANGAFDTDVTGWHAVGAAWSMAVEGGAVHVTAPSGQPVTREPFTEHPRADEVADVNLGDGLHARVPLVVARSGGHTLPAGDATRLSAALAALPQLDPTRVDTAVWLADVIVAWNLYAQFSPYFDVTGDDWDRALNDFLRDALDDVTPADHVATLHHVVARLHDGHGYVFANEPTAGPPVRFGWVEDKVVVLASTDPRVARGEIVVSIDGEDARVRLTRLTALQSGSEQWSQHHALLQLATGQPGTTVSLGLAHGAVAIERVATPPPEQWDRPSIAEIEPGIWYVDLDRAEMPAIEAAMSDLAKATGVVFDLRGYPKSNHDILRHVITKPDDKMWMHIPHLVRPRLRDIAGWTDETWQLTPEAPHLANVVFVTDNSAVSYAESVMGYVAYEGLPIVGAPTAGANGNMAIVGLPSGVRVSFTGMKVTRHDGGQQHLLGVRPTVPAAPTIAGLAANRDEVLERAVAVLQSHR